MDNGPGILPFMLGKTKIISHYHSFIQPVNLDIIRSNINLVRKQLDHISPEFHNKTLSLYQPHIEYLYSKISLLSDQLELFQSNRVKRGLIDGLGSVIKSISGNLDYSDAIRYDNAIKILQENDNKLVTELNNRASLNKHWMSQNSNILRRLIENQNKIKDSVNQIMTSNLHTDQDMVKYAHLAQFLLMLADNIETLSEEIIRLENLLAFIRAKSTHFLMLRLDRFKIMIEQLIALYGREQVLNVSFREYFNIIKLGYYYSNQNLVLVFQLPVVFPSNYDLYKLSIIPNKDNKVLIPSYPYLAIHDKDFMYIEAECPKSSQYYLCEDNNNHHYKSQGDCIYRLITTQQIDQSCQFTTAQLKTEAVEYLDDRHYVASFPAPTKIRLSCSETQYDTVQGSYLISIPKGCTAQTPTLTFANKDDRIRGQVLKIMNIPFQDKATYNLEDRRLTLNSADLRSLHVTTQEISMETPLQLNQADIHSVYYTITPLYLALLSATALGAGYVIRRYVRQRSQKAAATVHQTNEIECGDTYAEINNHTAVPQPRLSALFSNLSNNSR